MHPATKAHICGMLEVIRNSLKSIETAMVVHSNEGDAPPVKRQAKNLPMEDLDGQFTTPEEDDKLGELFQLMAKNPPAPPGYEQVDDGRNI